MEYKNPPPNPAGPRDSPPPAGDKGSEPSTFETPQDDLFGSPVDQENSAPGGSAIERLPQIAVAGVQDGAYTLPPPPGTYTLVALTYERPRMTNGHIPSEDDVFTNARWVAERVALKEGETLIQDLHIP